MSGTPTVPRPCLTLAPPDLQRLGADAVEDGEESALEGLSEHCFEDAWARGASTGGCGCVEAAWSNWRRRTNRLRVLPAF